MCVGGLEKKDGDLEWMGMRMDGGGDGMDR